MSVARNLKFEALSGRRAAQDGPRRRPGGLDRAATQLLCEVPSAGQVAAPGRLPGEGLGRGHSAARVARASAERAKPAELVGQVEARPCERAGLGLFQAMARAVLVLGLLVGPVNAADIVVGPGAQGTIEIPIENDEGSIQPLTNVRAQITAPSSFIVLSSSTLSSVLAGQTQNIVISYQIAGTATETDNPITVGLAVRMDGDDIEPAPSTMDSVVSLPTKPLPVLDGRAA
jgi:hypothetical protein